MSDVDFYGKEVRTWPCDRLTTASLIGHTTPTSVRLWMRVFAEGDYQLVVRKARPIPVQDVQIRRRGGRAVAVAREGGRLEDAEVLEVRFEYRRDLTRVVDLEGLDPGTRYYYALRRQAVPNAFEWEWELGYDTDRSFRTHDADPDEVAFGLYSCHMPFDGLDLVNMGMWEHFRQELADARAAFVIGAGDQVYTDGNPKVDIWRYLRSVKNKRIPKQAMVSWFRDIYRGYWGPPPVRRLLAALPHYMIWDDHEIMDGWGSYSESELSNQLDTFFEWENRRKNLELALRMWESAQQVYDEYEHGHNPEPASARNAAGERNWHYTFECGYCRFFVLDLRGHRFYRSDEDAQILGPEQMEDLVKWLDEDRGEVTFIVSSVPLVHAASLVINWLDLPFSSLKDDLRDHWEHDSHRAERERLLEAVFDYSHRSGKRVIFLSGDVHIAASLKLVSTGRFPNARVHQLTSSGITYAGLRPLARSALRLLVRDDGEIAPGPGGSAPIGRFKRLNVLPRNNFGIVRTRRSAETGEVAVDFDLYGASDVEGAIVRLERLSL